jgi:hypothetical protein
LERHWSAIRFGSLTVESEGGQLVFAVQIYLDELDPDAVSVEVYAEGKDGVFSPKDGSWPTACRFDAWLSSFQRAFRPAVLQRITHHP